MPYTVVDEVTGNEFEFDDAFPMQKARDLIISKRSGGATGFVGRGMPLSEVPGQALSNLPHSAYEFGKNIVSPLAHPIQTAEGIGRLMGGAADIAMGEGTQEAGATREVGKFFSDRYGGWENLKQTMAKDPVGFLADLSTVLAGGGAALGRAPGIVGKVGGVVSKAGEFTNPISVATAPLKGARAMVGRTNIPEELMARTMKMPPGSLRDEGRARVLKTLVREEKLPLGKNTLNKINKISSELDSSISKTLENLSVQNPQHGASTIDVNRLVNGLDDLKKTYRNRPNPKPYYEAIDAAKDDYLNHAFNNNGMMTLSDAHQLKKGTYQEIQSYYMKQQKPETGRVGIQNDIDAASKARAAKELRSAVLEHPDVPSSVRNDLQREAGLMNARKWVERATNRGGNLDPVSLSGMMFGILVEKGVPGVAAWRIATSQPVMSRLSIFFAHGSKVGRTVGEVTKPISLGLRGIDLLSP